MIQRVQSVYLLLAALLLALTMLFPLGSFQTQTGQIVDLTITSNFFGSKIWVFLVPIAFACLLCLTAIFLYQKRKRQIGLAYFALFFILLSLGFAVGYGYGFMVKHEASLVSVSGIFLPLVSIILVSLAIRKIKADEKLVRSLDRIR